MNKLLGWITYTPKLFIVNETQKQIYDVYRRNFLRGHRQFREYFEKTIDMNKKESKQMYKEYILLYYLIGLEPEEYFVCCNKGVSWIKKLRIVSRLRQNMFQLSVNKQNDNSVIDDKIKFNKKFKKFIHREWAYTKGMSKDELDKVAQKLESIIVKPYNGCGGKGIEKYNWSQISDIMKKDLLDVWSNGEYILEKQLIQTGVLHDINPTSVNTVRINTLLEKTGEVKVLNAFLRTGLKGAIVDNLHSGGILWHIDINTGRIIYGSRTDRIEKYSEHPDSGINLSGEKIQGFEDAVKICCEAQRQVPQVPQVGWDVVISENYIALIEGNSGSGFWNVSDCNVWKIMKKYLVDNKIEINCY